MDIEGHAHVEGSIQAKGQGKPWVNAQVEGQGKLEVNAQAEDQGQLEVNAQQEDEYVPITTYPFEILEDISRKIHVHTLTFQHCTSHHAKLKGDLE